MITGFCDFQNVFSDPVHPVYGSACKTDGCLPGTMFGSVHKSLTGTAKFVCLNVQNYYYTCKLGVFRTVQFSVAVSGACRGCVQRKPHLCLMVAHTILFHLL